MWHWTVLPIDPVTSRSPCLSHPPVSEPGGEVSGLSLPWTSHDLGCDRPEISVKDKVTFAAEGRWQIFGVLTCAQNKHQDFAAKFRHKFRRWKNRISPLSCRDQNQNFAAPPEILPRPELALPLPCLSGPLTSHSPIDLHHLTVASHL